MWDCEKVGQSYYLLTAHNTVIKTDQSLVVSGRFGCEEKCILYSGLVVPSTVGGQEEEGVCVLAGSVFSKILIWEPGKADSSEATVLHR